MTRAIKLAAEIEEGRLATPVASLAPAIERTHLDLGVSEFLKLPLIEESTRRRYGAILNTFIGICEDQGLLRVDQVTLRHTDYWLACRREALKESTLKEEFNKVRQFLDWCAARQMIACNPLADQKPRWPKIEKVDRALTVQQVASILAGSSPTWRPMLAVLALTGMRSGECSQLRVEDFDSAGNCVHIVSRQGARTKTKKGRKVPVHPVLKALLDRIPKHGDGPLFVTASGGPFDPGKLNKHFLDVCRKVGVPAGQAEGFTVHSLRHFFKSYCIDEGVPREYVDDWQGHSRIRRASDFYVHTDAKRSQQLIDRVNFKSFNFLRKV